MNVFRFAPALFFALCCVGEIVAILRATHGVFTYSVDDPYIHLAVAENILRGTYGINLNHSAAPCSSILWPFLLVPFTLTPWSVFGPLVLNLAAGMFTVEVLRRFFDSLWEPKSVLEQFCVTAAVCVAFVSTNVVGLVFTGMEHSLQVLLVVLILYGARLEQRDRRLRPWVVVSITCLPLIRYESAAFAVAFLIYFFWRGHRSWTLAAGAVSATSLLGFSLFLKAQGLWFLPSSVIAKARPAGDGALLMLVNKVVSVVQSVHGTPRATLFLALLFAFAGFAAASRQATSRGIALSLAAATAGHLFVGNYGQFGRYEVYLWTAQLLGIAWMLSEAVKLAPQRVPAVALTAALGVFALSLNFASKIVKTPGAARNIYEQQFQMRRFVVDFYRKPVAINDLGLVSYQNDNYVLDLWGLGSIEVLALRAGSPSSDWIGPLTARHGVELAMIYEDYFDKIPETWTRLGTLKLAGALVSAGDDEVSFWATAPASAAEIGPLLERFAATLPPGVTFSAGARRPAKSVGRMLQAAAGD